MEWKEGGREGEIGVERGTDNGKEWEEWDEKGKKYEVVSEGLGTGFLYKPVIFSFMTVS